MVFAATLSTLGSPEFGIIHIDPEQTAIAFQKYLNTASKLTGVSLEDISCAVSDLPSDPESATLVELLKCGMKLFDAVVWITAGRPVAYPLLQDPTMDSSKIPSLHDIARAVFYCYFMLIVQARYPASSKSTDKPKIPNFLKTIMGMEDEQHIYVERICSFEPQKFDPAWARYVKFQGFGQEVLSRFGLGVAGYRMFGPFSLYKPKQGLQPDLQRSFNFAQKVAKAPASWDLHPLTRNPNVLSKRGNLNKNLGNLILASFTDADIDEMVAAKVIFQKPTREPTHRQYLVWGEDDDISGNQFIFNS